MRLTRNLREAQIQITNLNSFLEIELDKEFGGSYASPLKYAFYAIKALKNKEKNTKKNIYKKK